MQFGLAIVILPDYCSLFPFTILIESSFFNAKLEAVVVTTTKATRDSHPPFLYRASHCTPA